MKYGLIVICALTLVLGVSANVFAFHSGGVAECSGCHSMHSPKASGSFLLIGTDQSSTCLSCHEHAGDTAPNGYHISTAAADLASKGFPMQRTPGGDFGWLKKDFTFIGEDGVTQTTELGQTHGHNIVAIDNSYAADTANTQAPGGTFSSSQLGCQSCHDPHGKARRLSDGTLARTGAPIIGSGSYNNSAVPAAGEAVGVYRLLRAAGDNSQGVNYTTTMVAVAPSTYNRTEAATQTRVAYGATGTNTVGNWCATCHNAMHSANGYVHPVDQSLGSTLAANYNSYKKSGDLTGVTASAFTSLVPFMEGTGTYSVLASHAMNNDSQLGGPATGDKVSCLTCHRAHASGWENGLRWYTEYEFMTKAGNYVASDNAAVTGSRAGVQHRGRTIAVATAAYYDRPATVFATYQRSLCNKCHAQD